MRHIIGIPTMDIEGVWSLHSSLVNSEVKPDKIYVIDNESEKPYNDKYMETTEVLSFGKNIGVNSSFNIFMQKARVENAHLTLLNDDVKIKPDFLKKIQMALSRFKKFQVFCPNTTHSIGYFENVICGSENHLIPMAKREAWAMTMRRSCVLKMPDIPDQLKIFFGDDWFWLHTSKYGYAWYKDINNIVYHSVGATLKKNPELRKMLLSEKRKWNKIIEGIK